MKFQPYKSCHCRMCCISQRVTSGTKTKRLWKNEAHRKFRRLWKRHLSDSFGYVSGDRLG